MAAVAMSSSTMLNPNAPIFVPAAFRQVEDFSPEWWELVKTSAWFREYWLSEHGEESFAADDEYDDLSPEFFDLGFDEEFADLDVQFQELPESKSREKKYGNGVGNGNNGKDAISALMKNLSMGNPKANQRSRKSRLGGGRRSYFEKAAAAPAEKKVNVSLRRIQQPR